MTRFSPKQVGLFVAILTAVALLWLVGSALAGFSGQNENENMRIATVAVDRAARQCYALEGAYPPDLAYLVSHYGLLLDQARYHYFYDVIGANIYPIIEVQKK
jgi:hypothetical protein